MGVQTHARNIEGRMLDVNGDVMELEAPNTVGIIGDYDIIEIDTLLAASGTPTLDMAGTGL